VFALTLEKPEAFQKEFPPPFCHFLSFENFPLILFFFLYFFGVSFLSPNGGGVDPWSLFNPQPSKTKSGVSILTVYKRMLT
jgi:hypothetical protein